MKKFFISLLSGLMLVSCLSGSIFADDALSQETKVPEQKPT